MNTVDPNLKVQQQLAAEEPSAPSAPPAAAEQQVPQQHSGNSDNVDYKLNGNVQAEAAQPNAALPAYHHHRSTALW